MAENEISDADELRTMLMETQELYEPVWEAALGVKNRLLNDGWSEETAGRLADEWTTTLLLVLRQAYLEGDG